MFQRWPKRDPVRNCFLMPNEIFCLGLDSREMAIYAYLLRCEDRETYQCRPSYRTIGKAVGMCENTVRKYVLSLEEKGLICTEPTMITTKDDRARNESLRYTIRPIQEALNCYYQQQLCRLRMPQPRPARKSGWPNSIQRRKEQAHDHLSRKSHCGPRPHDRRPAHSRYRALHPE